MSDPEILHISFVDGEIQTVAVTLLRPNVYRLEWTPLIIWGDEEPGLELYLGDTIETQMEADGTLRFLRVVERSQFRHYDWLVPRGFFDSVQCTEFGDAVEAAGGKGSWEDGYWYMFPSQAVSTSKLNSTAALRQLCISRRLTKQ